MSAADLRGSVGGHWDGDDRELHGLVTADGRAIKVELMRGGDLWIGTAFEGGAAVASSRGPNPVELVQSILRELER